MKHKYKLNLILTLFVFFIILISNVFISICLAAMYLSGAVDRMHMVPLVAVILALAASICVATVLTRLLSRYFIRPIHDVIRAMEKVTDGDFSVRLDENAGARPRRIWRQSEIGTLIRSFNEMTKELGSVEIFRRDFISDFSHEFKTPILSIRGFARQLEKEDLTPEERAEFVRIIADESEYLSKMSSNILLLTNLEHKEIITDRVPFRLDEQLRDCLLLFENQWSEKNLSVECELEEIVYTQNAELLAHAWTNLISNAVKFTPEGGAVFVGCSASEEGVKVTVRDTGIGMDETTQKHIFDKFYQGDPSRKTPGNGLGLPLVQRIVTMAGGSIALESVPGKGTAFTVSLPGTAPSGS